MFCHTLSPYQGLDLHRFWQREVDHRAEVVRLLRQGAPERPGLTGQALLLAGGALVSVGEWLKSRSRLVSPATRYAGQLQ